MGSESAKRKIAIVTGADGGIGMEFCRALARRGYALVMVSVTDTPLREAASLITADHGVQTWPLTLNLAHEEAPARLLDFLLNRGLEEDVDVLVNNAGIFSFDYLTETPAERVNLFVDLHVRSVAQLCRLFGARFASRGHGFILNMSSMSCWMPMPGLSLYASTKAFIRVLSRSIALELRDSGVRVMAATPGGIATPLFGLPPRLLRLAVALGVLTRPEKFAERCVRRMFKGKQQYINGMLNRISIVAVAASPRCVRMLVKRRLLDKDIRKK